MQKNSLMEATRDDVKSFLDNLRLKIDIFGVIYLNRSKNTQTLLDLDISPSSRTKIIKELKVEDYSEGPLSENMNGWPDMWVFGKQIKGTEVYIKVSMGNENNKSICISFHSSEHPMQYPFK